MDNCQLIFKIFQSRALTSEDDRNDEIFKSIAKNLANLHSLEIPIPRNNHHEKIHYLLNGWVKQKYFDELYSNEMKQFLNENNCQHILTQNVQLEIQSFLDFLDRTDFPITFSHCDFNHTNILVNNSSQNQFDIQFIDFDYACYNYRGL